MQFLDKYEAFLKERTSLAEGSIKNYLSQARIFLDKYPTLFDSDNTEEIIEALEKHYFNRQRVWHQLTAIKLLFSIAQRTEIFEEFRRRNKRGIKPLPRKQLKKSLTKDEIKAMAKYLENPYDIIFMIEYETALRISASKNLRPNDLEIIDDKYKITVMEKGNKITTKFLHSSTSFKLYKWIETNKIARNEPVFKMHYSTILRKYQKVSLKLFGERITTHWLRTSRAIHMFNDGYSLLEIMRYLGHTDPRVTLRYLAEAGVEPKKIIEREVDLFAKED